MDPKPRREDLFARRNVTTLALGGIFVAACCLRIWIAFFSKATWYNHDTYVYMDMANSILGHKPYSYVPNGYPLIIAILKCLVGATLLPAALIVLNVVASSLIVLLCYGIGSSIMSEQEGLLAAALVAVWPNQLNYMRQILSETPATFFLVLGIYSVIKYRPLRGGTFLVLASLIRSTLLPIVFLAFVWMCLRGTKRNELLRYAAGAMVIFCLNFALLKLQVIAPDNNSGTNLLIAIQSTSTEGIYFGTDLFTPDQRAKPLRTYLSFAEHSPGAFVKQRISSLWELWGPWPEPGTPTPWSNLARLVIGLRCLLLTLALVELGHAYKSAYHWLLVVPILVITCVHVVFFSTPRFSYPAEPFVIVLCAFFVVRLGRQCIYRWQRRGPSSLAVA